MVCNSRPCLLTVFSQVFKKIEKQLQNLTTLDLQFVSPALLKARDLQLAVPGTYQAGRPVITIVSFATKLVVIQSKQRPRRLSLRGSDGKDYQYALKGLRHPFGPAELVS